MFLPYLNPRKKVGDWFLSRKLEPDLIRQKEYLIRSATRRSNLTIRPGPTVGSGQVHLLLR